MKTKIKKTPWFAIVAILSLNIIALFVTTGCEKHEKPEDKFEIEHINTKLGGCNIQQPDLTRSGSEIANGTTVAITLSADSVNVFVGFPFACKKYPFETQVEFTDSVMYIHLFDKCYSDENCYYRCLCYYTWDFVFKYQGEINQKYKILLHQTLQTYGEKPIFIISEGIMNAKNG